MMNVIWVLTHKYLPSKTQPRGVCEYLSDGTPGRGLIGGDWDQGKEDTVIE